MLILRIVLYFLSIIHMISIVLAFIKKDFWIFRVFDYPRLQKFVIMSSVVVVMGIYFTDTIFDWTIICLLVISLIYLAYLILPFTVLGKTMVNKVEPGSQEKLHLLVSNVFQDNTQYDKLLQLITNRSPDVVFLLETNQRWKEQMEVLKVHYPYFIEIPKENTYGLLFFSKLKIVNHEVNYLIDPEIPSIVADIEFDNRLIKIYGLHPTPPSPGENSHSTDRDAEILMVGKKVKEQSIPCLVMGDLNDVAFSYTTDLFLKTSGLLDPRRGRGFYNTYNAKYIIFRWPLDHYFVSGHFRLITMKVEKSIGSDHFPISIKLVLAPEENRRQLTATAEEQELVEEKIDAGVKGEPL
jgi:endonuclease/exonuclease/phosphatase (EEP) superfamily protein YafD